MIAGIYNGRLYTSDDSGANWTERQPAGAINKAWRGVASDSDGSHLIASADGIGIYTSTDYGETWTTKDPSGGGEVEAWGKVASDSDGSNLMVIDRENAVYVSIDYGLNWTIRSPKENECWSGATSDSDGSNLMTSISVGLGKLYISNNQGASWNEFSYRNGNWSGMASDSDGSHLIAGQLNQYIYDGLDQFGEPTWHSEDGGRLFTSSDSGATWTERQPAGNIDKIWIGVASDSDGSHLIAAVEEGRLYTSDDYGETWTEEQPAGDVNKNWSSVASDLDGSNLIVAVSSGRLYTKAVVELYSEATWAEADLTSAGRELLDDTTTTAQQNTLGLGTDDSPEFAGIGLTGFTGLVLATAGLLSANDLYDASYKALLVPD